MRRSILVTLAAGAVAALTVGVMQPPATARRVSTGNCTQATP